MGKNLCGRASRFFQETEGSAAFEEYIKEANQVIQFVPDDGEPFYIQIRQGKVDLGEGEKYPVNFEEGLYITGKEEAMESLFLGEVSLAEAIYDHKIRIPGYRKKEPLMVWFSRLLRKGRGLKD